MLLARFERPDPELVRHRLARLFRARSGAPPATEPVPDAGSHPSPASQGAGPGASAPPAAAPPPAHGAPAHQPAASDTAGRSTSDAPRRTASGAESASPEPDRDPPPTGSPERRADPPTERLSGREAPDDGPDSTAGRLSGRIAAAFGVHGARIDPGGTGTRALAGLAVAVVLIAAAVAWWSQPKPEPVAPRVAAPTVRPSATATGVVVAVAGKVRRPGLVTLPAGARVADAIKAAGGVLPGTDVGYLNLARKVTDGELIVVGASAPPGDAAGGPGGPAGGPGGPAAPGDPAGKVNLNTATLQQLDTLPGVGPVLAQRILDYRDDHGGFRSVDELRQVDGIGPSRYEQLKDLVTV